MSWERRLREMLLAGGAIVSAACGGVTRGSDADAAASGDATTDGSQDAGDEPPGTVNICCNADPDPCCGYELCEASLSAQCEQEMQCQEAGLWDASSYTCETPPADGGQADAVQDVVSTPGPCCNGNPDPCCPYELCDAAASPQCTCELEGGLWDAGFDEAGQYVGTCQAQPPVDAGTDGGG